MEKKRITIDTRIIQHLGKDLITSPDVAIIELIKNSIDAKADIVNLHLFDCFGNNLKSNNFITTIPQELFSFIPDNLMKSSVLIVEDNGIGMSVDQLENGFLKIGTDIKSKKTDDNNIVLGEKGIGRLAAQRLGSKLIIETSSYNEDFISLTYLDWDEIIKGENSVPYSQIKKDSKSYTRLWIFNVNLEELLEYPVQLSFDFVDTKIDVNRDLKSSLNFFISPFNTSKSKISINVFFNNSLLDTCFPIEMLEFSESNHYFYFNCNHNISLRYGLKLQPWFIERIHHSLAKADFAKLKKPHKYYKELLEENMGRINQALTFTISYDELCERIISFYKDTYQNLINKTNKEVIEKYFYKQAETMIGRLCEIAPIYGEIYSFKQNYQIGQDIIIESVKQSTDNQKIQDVNLKKLKQFLENYNGIKLYRGIYRIGYLGNKESDWIKLQQYRTKGQQFFRFDLGNTVGYVSLNDPHQEKINEISSRLDISLNKVSESFKNLVLIIFNILFYELNQKAYGIVKVILEEKGLLAEPLKKRVIKNVNSVKQIISKNKKLIKSIQEVKQTLDKNVVIEGASAIIPKTTYEYMSKVIVDIDEQIKQNQDAYYEAANLLTEADKQLKAIEVESFNNYKLMANGLITETITHELHSISTTNNDFKVDLHFEYLKNHFLANKEVKIYNEHVYPIKNSYNVISSKINRVGDMYLFLEKTFIKKGTYDEFVEQNIYNIANEVFDNLKKASKIRNIDLKCNDQNLSWFVPKGVLVHVFYNLFSNSIYWIDIRRKRAEKDSNYAYKENDHIEIEILGSNELIVSDTGTGVSPHMQDILFEPLQSGKPEGRGMGLYIIKKLMNSFDGDIILLQDINKYGNRYKFLLTREKEDS